MKKLNYFFVVLALLVSPHLFAQENELSSLGYRGFISIGGGSYWVPSLNSQVDAFLNVSTTHGFQACKYFYGGIGCAYNHSINLIPLYADLRVEMPKGNFIPSLDVKMGNAFSPISAENSKKYPELHKNFYFNPSVVFSGVITKNLSIGFSLGYTLIRTNNGGLIHAASGTVEFSGITGK